MPIYLAGNYLPIYLAGNYLPIYMADNYLPIYLAGNYLPIYLAGPINVKIYMIINIKKSTRLILSNLKIQFIVDFNIVLKILRSVVESSF